MLSMFPAYTQVCGDIRWRRYLSSSQQAVDAFQEARIDQLVVLKEEADGLTLNPSLQHQRLQVAVEGLQVVPPRHTRRPHLQKTDEDSMDDKSHRKSLVVMTVP